MKRDMEPVTCACCGRVVGYQIREGDEVYFIDALCQEVS